MACNVPFATATSRRWSLGPYRRRRARTGRSGCRGSDPGSSRVSLRAHYALQEGAPPRTPRDRARRRHRSCTSCHLATARGWRDQSTGYRHAWRERSRAHGRADGLAEWGRWRTGWPRAREPTRRGSSPGCRSGAHTPRSARRPRRGSSRRGFLGCETCNSPPPLSWGEARDRRSSAASGRPARRCCRECCPPGTPGVGGCR